MYSLKTPEAPLALTTFGIVPFLAPAGLMLRYQDDPIFMSTAGLWLIAYAAVILSFLGGGAGCLGRLGSGAGLLPVCKSVRIFGVGSGLAAALCDRSGHARNAALVSQAANLADQRRDCLLVGRGLSIQPRLALGWVRPKPARRES